MNLTRGINLRLIAEMMPGASGAEVKVGLQLKISFVNISLDSCLTIIRHLSAAVH